MMIPKLTCYSFLIYLNQGRAGKFTGPTEFNELRIAPVGFVVNWIRFLILAR
jgi:hypothetical protein